MDIRLRGLVNESHSENFVNTEFVKEFFNTLFLLGRKIKFHKLRACFELNHDKWLLHLMEATNL